MQKCPRDCLPQPLLGLGHTLGLGPTWLRTVRNGDAQHLKEHPVCGGNIVASCMCIILCGILSWVFVWNNGCSVTGGRSPPTFWATVVSILRTVHHWLSAVLTAPCTCNNYPLHRWHSAIVETVMRFSLVCVGKGVCAHVRVCMCVCLCGVHVCVCLCVICVGMGVSVNAVYRQLICIARVL